MLSLRRKDIVCQQAVELVTDYLEGPLSSRPASFEAQCGLPQLFRLPGADPA